MPPVVSILLALDRDSILRIVVRAQRSAWSGLVAACRRSITSDCDNMIDMPLFGNDVMLHNGEPDVPILLRVDTRRYTKVLYQVVQLVLTLAHADWSGFRQGISVGCWGHPLLLASLVYSHVSTLQGTPSLGPQAQHQISLGQPC